MKHFYENSCLGKEIALLPLAYKKSSVFSCVFLFGDLFQKLTNCPFSRGMCGRKAVVDDVYPLSLVVDDGFFEKGFPEVLTLERKLGMIHELGHVIHGAYFDRMGCLGEGFAELLPHYLMDFDSRNDKHRLAVISTSEDEIQTIDFIHKNGMFSLPEDKDKIIQERSSYKSVICGCSGISETWKRNIILISLGRLI